MNGLNTKYRAQQERMEIAITLTREAAIEMANTISKRPIYSVDHRRSTTRIGQVKRSSRINNTKKNEDLKTKSLISTSEKAAITLKIVTSP